MKWFRRIRKWRRSRRTQAAAARLPRWRLVFRVFSVLTFFLVFSTGGYAFSRYLNDTNYLRIRTIRVDGATALNLNRIVEQSGITKANNVIFLDQDAVAARIRALPFIEWCHVTRVFPDQVIISVEERIPVATLLAHNKAFLIDESLNVLEELMPGQPHVGPFVTELPGLGAIKAGQHLELAPLSEALDVLTAFNSTTMSGEVTLSEIAAPHENEIRMFCDELPYEIRWGRGLSQEQAKRLEILWGWSEGNISSTEYVDLRFGEDVACR
ncbi:MAG: FtsQ-type POTRA domain-containing protein [Candidatus Hydrogenedentes bacterium]|nr:FtsQ-type POTRA domain-containing protein [Candidatus Hydrogenedentota bacterium]